VQSHYVERSHKIFVVNSSYVFSFLWRAVQPLINENTKKKISILSSDFSELLNHIDACQLPVRYGGLGGELGEACEEQDLWRFVDQLNQSTPASPPQSQSSLKVSLKSSAPLLSSQRGGVFSEALSGWGGEGEMGQESTDSDSDSDSDGAPQLMDSANLLTSPPSTVRTALGWFVGAGQRAVSSSVSAISSLMTLPSSSQTEAHLGSKNDYKYDSARQKWVLQDSGGRTSVSNPAEPLSLPPVKEEEQDKDEEEQMMIRAIQAAHGYVSESDEESADKKSLSTADSSRRSFRRMLIGKKRSAERVLSLWTVMLWAWRLGIGASLESLSAFCLMSVELGGLGLSPLVMGALVFASTSSLSLALLLHYAMCPTSSEGFFARSIPIVLTQEVVAFSIFIILSVRVDMQPDAPASPLSRVLSAVIVLCLFALFFSQEVAGTFTLTVFSSSKSHLYSSRSRPRVHLVDGVGCVIGFLLMLLTHSVSHSLWPIVTCMIFTCSVHVTISLVNWAYPHAAGHGVDLGTVVW
jgi:hypothetical protein